MSLVKITVHGKEIEFDAGAEDDYIRGRILATGQFFEQPMLDYILANYPEQYHILDIGANWGNHTLFFGKFLRYGAISCFEPNPAMFKLLDSNVWDINKCPCTMFHNVALGAWESKGSGRILEDKNAGTFTIHQDPDGEIPIRTLDSYDLANVTLIKLDAEWMELQVLAGGMDTLARCRPMIFAEGRDQAYMDPICALLAPLGYKWEWMQPITGDNNSWRFWV